MMIPIKTYYDDHSDLYYFVSIDGGSTWTPHLAIKNMMDDDFEVRYDFTDESQGWMTVHGRELLRSDESLGEWKVVLNIAELGQSPKHRILDIEFISDQEGFILIGSNKINEKTLLYTTIDEGETWTLVDYTIND